MKKSRITLLLLFTTLPLVGCTNNQGKQLQQQNDLLQQQNNTLLQQQGSQQDTNPNTSGYPSVTDNTHTPNDTNVTGNTKTIPFNAVGPANNNSNNNYY